MAIIDYLFCDWSQIGVREMSYDEFCIAAFGKDAEDYGCMRITEYNKNKNDG